MSAAERAWALVVSGVLLGLVAWPAVHGRDGFPFSSYPMFAKPRPRVARIPHVVAFTAESRHRPVPPDRLGTDEVMQAFRTVDIAIARGDAEALCQRVRATLAGDTAWADAVRIEVREDWFDVIAYWRGDRKPRKQKIAASCPRGASP